MDNFKYSVNFILPIIGLSFLIGYHMGHWWALYTRPLRKCSYRVKAKDSKIIATFVFGGREIGPELVDQPEGIFQIGDGTHVLRNNLEIKDTLEFKEIKGDEA